MSSTAATKNLAPRTLVTGASRRIGAQIIRRLHSRGHRLVLHYRSGAEEARALSAELNQSRPGSVHCVAADLDEPEQRETLMQWAWETLGGLDNLVNNASRFTRTPIGSLNVEQLQQSLSSNLLAPVHLTLLLARRLNGRVGAIVNILDIYAAAPLPSHTAYSISKSALAMATQCLAVELGARLRINAVSPGTVLWSDNPQKAESPDTLKERSALQRVGSPDDVARAVAFLLDEADYCTGSVITVDGGRSLYR